MSIIRSSCILMHTIPMCMCVCVCVCAWMGVGVCPRCKGLKWLKLLFITTSIQCMYMVVCVCVCVCACVCVCMSAANICTPTCRSNVQIHLPFLTPVLKSPRKIQIIHQVPVHTHTDIHVHMFTHTHIHTYTCSHVHIFTCTHVHMYTCSHTHTYNIAY